MSKRSPIPPIKPNPRRGKESPTDASVVWGGAEPPKEPTAPKKQPGRPRRTGRRNRQQNFCIADPGGLTKLSKKWGVNKTAVINLLIAEKIREWNL